MADPKSPYDLGELSKLLSNFKIPEIDWQGVMAAHQKNWAALSEANQVWLEGAQKVMHKEVEVLQKAMAEAAEASKEMMKEGDARAAAEKRLEHAKASFESAVSNMRERSDLMSKSGQEALNVIHRRALENFEEIKALLKSKS
ncbi:MAG: TIGR01841 family phasin [Pseudomonadota bacterium]